MQYLDAFKLASADEEDSYVLSFPAKLEMSCYSGQVYPFKVFPQKGFEKINFAPITIFYGGNGSGKSTLLNIIAEKTDVLRTSPFNNTPYFEDYLELCKAEYTFEDELPRESRIITSDDVFDFMLNLRALNEGVDHNRNELFDEWQRLRNTGGGNKFQMRSLEDLDELNRNLDAWKHTRSDFTARRLPSNIREQSNGESAYGYFAEKIRDGALYLLDEPENSLSAQRQAELADFLTDSARFYGCQFVISTHSPFLLSIRGARIYDLDSRPVCIRPWTELPNVRLYFDFFRAHRDEFS